MTKPIGWVWQYADTSYGSRLHPMTMPPDTVAAAYGEKAVYVHHHAESPPEALSIRDEAELRILAAMVGGYWADPNMVSINRDTALADAKEWADLWMKARTV